MKDVKGKTIWIIGASSGIGNALAKELDAHGARLVLSARREEKLQELAKELKGDKHIVAPLDVSNVDEVRQGLQAAIEAGARVNSAIFLAAIYEMHGDGKKDLDFIRKALDVNVMGAFNLIDVIQDYYEEKGGGQLVICGSVAGYRGLPTGQPYCATKAALINLAESKKVELTPKNIDVKVICPGFVETPLTDKNDFPMPMIIKAEEAAKAIHKGICSSSFEIHFPKKFTFIMKFLRIMPNALYFAIAKKMRPSE